MNMLWTLSLLCILAGAAYTWHKHMKKVDKEAQAKEQIHLENEAYDKALIESNKVWAEYDQAWGDEANKVEASPKFGRYMIQRGPFSGLWGVSKWQVYWEGKTNRPFQFIGCRRAIPAPPPAIEVIGYYKPVNNLEFATAEKAEKWLYEWLHPEERSHYYDEEGRPINKVEQLL